MIMGMRYPGKVKAGVGACHTPADGIGVRREYGAASLKNMNVFFRLNNNNFN